MFKTVMTTLFAATLLGSTASFAGGHTSSGPSTDTSIERELKESGEKGGNTSSGLPKENREFNIGMPPSVSPPRDMQDCAANTQQSRAKADGKDEPCTDREAKESGEKGGTADINIGVGELQE